MFDREITWASVILAAVVLLSAASSRAWAWDVASIAQRDTIRLQTDCPGEGPYTFPVWVVAVDGHVFVRLGSRAADRVECAGHSTVGVEIGTQHYDVRWYAAPELVSRVDAAMAAKYPSDLLIRWFPHRLVARLDP